MSILQKIEDGAGNALHVVNGLSHAQVVFYGAIFGIAVVGASYGIWHHIVYKEGVEACEAKQEGVNKAYEVQLEVSKQHILDLTQELAEARAKAKVNRPAASKAVQDVINANPIFANYVRPDAIYAQRVRELKEIREAGSHN